MGGVCTGGTLKRSTAADYGSDKSSTGFSGKLRSVKSFNHQQKKNDYDNGNDDSVLSSSYTQDNDVYHRKTTSYDSGELFSISRELKPSTPARVASKVYIQFLSLFSIKSTPISLFSTKILVFFSIKSQWN